MLAGAFCRLKHPTLLAVSRAIMTRIEAKFASKSCGKGAATGKDRHSLQAAPAHSSPKIRHGPGRNQLAHHRQHGIGFIQCPIRILQRSINFCQIAD